LLVSHVQNDTGNACISEVCFPWLYSMCVCVCVCVCAPAGEVLSESAEDVEETGYHAERDDIVIDEDHVAPVSTKGKAEVQMSAAFVA